MKRLLLWVLLFLLVFFSFKKIYRAPTRESQIAKGNLTDVIVPPSIIPTPPTITDLYANRFDLKKYKDCTIYLRHSMNVLSSSSTLSDRSEIRCIIDGEFKSIIIVTDKPGFPDAKNNIYYAWDYDDGIKLMVVDQNGAGSGEGVGKIVNVHKDGSDIESCFYYTHESFHDGYNMPYAEKGPPTSEGLLTISRTSMPVTNKECLNYVVEVLYFK